MPHKHITTYIFLVLIILIALLSAMVYSLVSDIHTYSRQGVLRPEELPHGWPWPLRHLGEPTSTNMIQSWMTFTYLDRIFKLPPGYLSGTLAIKDPRYPYITITKFASDNHLTSSSAISSVKIAIMHAPSSTTSTGR